MSTQTNPELESSFVNLELPARIWALIFAALHKVKAGLPLVGLGACEFVENEDSWVGSISSEGNSVHVYVDFKGNQKLVLGRRITELRRSIREINPRLSVVIPKESEIYEEGMRQKKELKAQEQQLRRDLKKAETELAGLAGSLDYSISLAMLSELPAFSMQVPGDAIVTYEQKQAANESTQEEVEEEEDEETEKQEISEQDAQKSETVTLTSEVAASSNPSAEPADGDDDDEFDAEKVGPAMKVLAEYLASDEYTEAVASMPDGVISIALHPEEIEKIEDELAAQETIPGPISPRPAPDAKWLALTWAHPDEESTLFQVKPEPSDPVVTAGFDRDAWEKKVRETGISMLEEMEYAELVELAKNLNLKTNVKRQVLHTQIMEVFAELGS